MRRNACRARGAKSSQLGGCQRAEAGQLDGAHQVQFCARAGGAFVILGLTLLGGAMFLLVRRVPWVHPAFVGRLIRPLSVLCGDNRTGDTIAPKRRWVAVSNVAGRES